MKKPPLIQSVKAREPSTLHIVWSTGETLPVDVTRLVKRFKLTERNSVTFRAEAYNLFNNVNFQVPTATLTSGTFGKISTNYNGARIMQLALRYDF